MAFENIRFSKPNMVAYGGYFWMIDDVLDMLVLKTDDGTQAFTYPLDTAVDNGTVQSIEFDGYNLWTLEKLPSLKVRVRRWYIHNYILKMATSFDFVATTSDSYSSYAMAVESYQVQFSSDESSNQQTLSIGDDAAGAVCSKIQSGYTVVLGPNSDGRTEEFSVSSAGADFVIINGRTAYAYESGDLIRFYNHIWLFNDYNGVDSSTGALYKISAYTGSLINKYSNNSYKGVLAATFCSLPRFVFNDGTAETPKDHAICYVKSTNAIFLNPDDLDTAFGSLAMDNLESNLAVIIPVYDISISDKNVYRLQLKATYYGVTGTFNNSTFNYQLSTLNALINSISLNANPAILPANGESTSVITAIVKDQFGEPISGKPVYFTDDDDNGIIEYAYVNTDENGQAVTVYKAGIDAREVRISSTCQQ